MTSTKLTPRQVKSKLDAGQAVAFLDDRGQEAWDRSDEKIRGAIRVPADRVDEHLDEVPRDRTIVTYCT